MKKLIIFLFGITISYSLLSQNNVSLRLDSTRTWTKSINWNGDTTTTVRWEAFDYDQMDRLIQRRIPSHRNNFRYSADTVYRQTEFLNSSNEWVEGLKTTSVYQNGLKIWSLDETKYNEEFENGTLSRYYYNESGLDTLYKQQHWVDEEWVDFHKIEKKYDVNGNCIEELQYYVYDDNNFDFSRGELMEYDSENRLVEKVTMSHQIGNYNSRISWIYGENGLIDTIRRFRYDFPNEGTWNNTNMSSYYHFLEDSIETYSYFWSEDEWYNSRKTVSYPGTGKGSDMLDSVLVYSALSTPIEKTYYNYEDLDNGEVYFSVSYYQYSHSAWDLRRLHEEWYNLNRSNYNSESTSEDSNYIVLSSESEINVEIELYPNPVSVGQSIDIEGHNPNQEIEVLIFNLDGQLVSRNLIANKSSIEAPHTPGVYTLLIRQNNQLIGLRKQIVKN